MEDDIQAFLIFYNVNIVRFVNIEEFDKAQSRGFRWAIWFAIPMSADFIKRFNNKQCEDKDEFSTLEKETDRIGDLLSEHLVRKGYQACSQSEESNTKNGAYMEDTMISLLPHKTFALLSGIGWIGKNNLLVTQEYGCALSTCTVLTNAPINISSEKAQIHNNLCGSCTVCQGFCNCITGRTWSRDLSRNDILNVYDCTC
jgi:epoxyqueuosine reductase QueG